MDNIKRVINDLKNIGFVTDQQWDVICSAIRLLEEYQRYKKFEDDRVC